MRGQKPDEDIRLPMQWSDAAYYGFSGSKPWRTGDAGGDSAIVAVQENDPDSLLSHYKNLISLRHEYAALRTGTTEVLDLGTTAL